jgi:hypothetical protein
LDDIDIGNMVPPAFVTIGDEGRIRDCGQMSSCKDRGMMALGKTPGESIIIPFGPIIIGPAVGVAIRDPDIGVEELEPRKSDGLIICCW